MEKLKLGSLFDGIGGFPFAAMQWEIEPVWASEIEPFPIKVTEHHFPDMKHLGDITQINGAEIEPVDIITFGSPCQDLSVAGKREGLAGARSGLFMDAVRIIRGMRTATGGKYPRFAVWENVPGAFSSNGGEDFRAVLEEIAEAEIPMPASGKWANAGMVRTERVDIAWRVLDAQHWGVPQRRRRIFLVADFGGQCAGEILFKPEGLRGNITASRKAGKEVAGAVGSGAEGTDYLTGWDCQEKRIFSDRGIAPTLSGSDGGGGRTGAGFVAQCVTTGPGRRYDPETETLIPVMLSGDDKVRTLTARADSSLCVDRGQDVVIVPQVAGFSYKASPSAGGIGFKEEQSPTILSERQDSAVILLYDITHADEVVRSVKKGVSPTLNHRMGTGGNQIPICIQNATRGKSQSGLGISQADVSYTLDTLGNHAVAFPDPANTLLAKANLSHRGDTDNVVVTKYAVRRLTPLECLRLQGFPDYWLDIDGMSDTQKYKAIGNSVAIPCVSFILRRISEVLRRV